MVHYQQLFMTKLVIVYPNDRSRELKAYELRHFAGDRFDVLGLTCKEFMKTEPPADVLWPFFRDMPGHNEDVLTYIKNKSKYSRTTIFNDYRNFIVRPGNKWEAGNFVSETLGMQIPLSFKLDGIRDIEKAVSTLKKFPIVLKGYPSGGGQDVHLCYNNFQIAYLFLQKRISGKRVLLQEFVSEQPGTDLRLMLVGNRIIYSIKRISKDDFRANLALGAAHEEYLLSSTQKEQIVDIINLQQFDVVGVDFLFATGNKLVFNEFNSAPGGFESFSHEVSEALFALYKRKLELIKS